MRNSVRATLTLATFLVVVILFLSGGCTTERRMTYLAVSNETGVDIRKFNMPISVFSGSMYIPKSATKGAFGIDLPANKFIQLSWQNDLGEERVETIYFPDTTSLESPYLIIRLLPQKTELNVSEPPY